jgi:sialic acid synthase SpsE
MNNILIGQKKIGINCKPYFIGEIGINHNGSIIIAKQLIDMAAHVGIDAVKFQKRDYLNTISPEQLKMPYLHHNSFGNTYEEHKKALEFSDEELIELFEYSVKKGLDASCSAFNISSYDFIEEKLNPKFHKIASPQIVDHALLRHVASFGKPIFLSTGMSTLNEVKMAVDNILPINEQLVLLQCTTLYPTNNDEVNLRVIQDYRERFGVNVGFSSHDKSVIFPAVAVALGARVFEKHITLDRTMKGPDHSASFEERGLELSYKYALMAYEALGNNIKNPLEREKDSAIKHRHSIVAIKDLKAGKKT